MPIISGLRMLGYEDQYCKVNLSYKEHFKKLNYKKITL